MLELWGAGKNLSKGNHGNRGWDACRKHQCFHCEGCIEIQRFVSQDYESQFDASDQRCSEVRTETFSLQLAQSQLSEKTGREREKPQQGRDVPVFTAALVLR